MQFYIKEILPLEEIAKIVNKRFSRMSIIIYIFVYSFIF